VDDEFLVRQGLRMRLSMEPDMAIVGEAADGRSAVEAVPALAPDVVLMDVRMPVLDGIATTAALREAAPSSAVVVLSMQDDPATRERAMQAGAAAFVAKHQIERALTSAIRSVARRGRAERGPPA
jgi:DNA-binding NarL/FixJ family response regulator